jgi:hypothetical protein
MFRDASFGKRIGTSEAGAATQPIRILTGSAFAMGVPSAKTAAKAPPRIDVIEGMSETLPVRLFA